MEGFKLAKKGSLCLRWFNDKNEESAERNYYPIKSLDACARKCKEETHFECKGFSYSSLGSSY